MKIKLENKSLELLREVIKKRQPELLGLLTQLGDAPLIQEQRESLREALAAELCETGLDKNDEPNARGLELEELIDRVGHF